MKKTIKFILSTVCYLVFVVGTLFLTIFASWYLLPASQTTLLGKLFEEFIGKDAMLLTFLLTFILNTVMLIFSKKFNIIKNSKILNFCTHLLTWLISIALVVEAGYFFIMSGNIQGTVTELTGIRKIGILICIVVTFLYSFISPKFRVIVNRKIQAYDTAKELNVKGRSSVIGMQLLKCFDFICPEIFLLVALCFVFDWKVSFYFIFVICACIFPIIGNMICDNRVKKEAVRKEIEKQDAQVNATAEAVADILAQRNVIEKKDV